MTITRGTLRHRIGFLFLAAFASAVALGCSNARDEGGAGASGSHLTPAGTSVAGWTVTTGGSLHAKSATLEYIGHRTAGNCAGCHGSDLSGGISGTSCFGNAANCHHGTIAGWFDNTPGAAQGHGASAKRAPGNSSFFACQVCHGAPLTGGGSLVSCFAARCHNGAAVSPAPHPVGGWLGNSADNTHTDADPSNAPVCFGCHAFPGVGHAPNPNNPHPPSTPPAAGAPPDCFNGTMCHNQAGHPPGWQAGSQHGAAAKAAPDAAHGFAYCKTCHGATYAGTVYSLNVSCYTQPNFQGSPCHQSVISRPHPPGITWRLNTAPSHQITNTGNAPACGECHRASGVTPGTEGCFNNTLCHAT